MHRHTALRLLTAAVLAGLACSSSTSLCACPPAQGLGTVYGRVTRASGDPVPSIPVGVAAFVHGCDVGGNEITDETPSAVTGADGSYRYEIRTTAPSDTACVRVTVVERAGQPDAQVVSASVRMRLVPSSGGEPHPDSTRIDLRLQ